MLLLNNFIFISPRKYWTILCKKKVIAKLKNLQSTQFECEYYKILGTSIFNIQSIVVFPIKLQSFVQLFLYIKKYKKNWEMRIYFSWGDFSWEDWGTLPQNSYKPSCTYNELYCKGEPYWTEDRHPLYFIKGFIWHNITGYDNR